MNEYETAEHSLVFYEIFGVQSVVKGLGIVRIFNNFYNIYFYNFDF